MIRGGGPIIIEELGEVVGEPWWGRGLESSPSSRASTNTGPSVPRGGRINDNNWNLRGAWHVRLRETHRLKKQKVPEWSGVQQCLVKSRKQILLRVTLDRKYLTARNNATDCFGQVK